MFLVSYFFDFFSWISSLFITPTPSKVLFLGLDNAGKTTLCHYLRSGKMIQHAPTQYSNRDTVKVGNCTMTAFDLGGQEAARTLWKQYFIDIQGIVFMVGANEKYRFNEAKKELYGLLNDETIASIPVMILGSKSDRHDAVTEMELRSVLGLQTTGKSNTEKPATRPLEVFMTSVVNEQGIKEAFEWLSHKIK